MKKEVRDTADEVLEKRGKARLLAELINIMLNYFGKVTVRRA